MDEEPVLKTGGCKRFGGSIPFASAKYGVSGEMVDTLDCGSSKLRVRAPSDTL